jgi:hypothetical protein
MAAVKVDGRRFTLVSGVWYSNRTYKTKAGAQKYIDTLTYKARRYGEEYPNYQIVESHEYRYTRGSNLPTSGAIVYRVAVKSAE